MSDKFEEQWAILELMGHRRLGGYVQEVNLFGVPLLRIDIPGENDKWATQLYGAQAIYCLTPATEEAARAVAARNQPQPVNVFELPPPREKKVYIYDDYDHDGEDDGGENEEYEPGF
jgi:hypothetical protein